MLFLTSHPSTAVAVQIPGDPSGLSPRAIEEGEEAKDSTRTSQFYAALLPAIHANPRLSPRLREIHERQTDLSEERDSCLQERTLLSERRTTVVERRTEGKRKRKGE